jgi:hypothetical protein
MMNIKIKAIDSLRNATKNGCKFITFLYTSKGTGETSKYQINFGISNKSACEHDREALLAYVPQNALEETAKAELLKSLTETIEEGVSRSYTQIDTYDYIGKGIRQHKESGEIYIDGLIESKEQVTPPTNPKKPVNSRPLTIAKNAIKQACNFKRNRFGSFILNSENIGGVKVCGEVIELHA